jgi:antitoxin component YwqK of YwqJK toxin-antitoxin module
MNTGVRCVALLAALAGCTVEYDEAHWPRGNLRERVGVRIKQSGLYERHGPCRRWHENGRLAEHGSYVMGQRTGPWQTWYPNGRRRSEGHYRPRDEMGRYVDGIWVRWSEVECRHGPWREWYESGAPKSKGHYEYGEKVGPWHEWKDQGAPQ